ncbi:hypothetical protein JB92DRAFT_3123321 [Gautieria morchelliformis]|nr:hypothetical protein JB92DRAFT_3123321 [Gautieria morchelliformis]
MNPFAERRADTDPQDAQHPLREPPPHLSPTRHYRPPLGQPLILAPNSRLAPPSLIHPAGTKRTTPPALQPTTSIPQPVTQRRQTPMTSKVSIFKGNPGQDRDEWLQMFEKACYERGIDADETEKLKYLNYACQAKQCDSSGRGSQRVDRHGPRSRQNGERYTQAAKYSRP